MKLLIRSPPSMQLLLVLLLSCTYSCAKKSVHYQYCIIGAGPSGLQMGHFLQNAGRNYLIIERNHTAGSFFLHYPRHRRLISINKRYTGRTNKEFNLRHDWNSLISNNESLMMRHYSVDYFPTADSYVKYLQDFVEHLRLNIKYNTDIVSVARHKSHSKKGFLLKDQRNMIYKCDVVIVSTGVSVPIIPNSLPGIEHATGYESVSVDPKDFEGQAVLILGKGNSAFEVASNIVSSASHIHMISRSRLRLAYQTHYVGDLRAINDEILDTYQLKSLDGIFEAELDSEDQAILTKGNKLYLILSQELAKMQKQYADKLPDNNGIGTFQSGYDHIIRCLGFRFNFSIFTHSANPISDNIKKYPDLLTNYESSSVPDMFFAGAAAHSLDYKVSAGGFIHGFRYTARALYKHLQWKYHGVPWPSVLLSPIDLTSHLVKRINEASGIYQMFNVLADVAVIREDGLVDYLEEVPVLSLHQFKKFTGHNNSQLITLEMQYGQEYSGPGL
ncbi:FAD-dependent oxidoreductase domain-containing protein 2-like isoform X3 [Dysidea avara]|uniref:FAD-dependent oxidoreductase domain-containing protein 2-like isoform X3 n=1 Tax=Dysidea avara TaxID=196820 RepID=UPI003333DFB2